MNSEKDDSGDGEESLFYFESDHLALRGNRDYANVLRTIAVFEAQKVRIHQQLEDLVLARKRYLLEPEVFLEKLRNNEEIIAPNYMTIAKIPEVGTYETFPAEDVKVKEEPGSGSGPEMAPVIRGRVVANDTAKKDTFNQLWTCEEQRRLEELLIEYPAEEIEFRRFVKIAKALGNRTPQQVTSRVQKYFQKLHDVGMPIPGRRPKNRRNQSKTKYFYRPSTFFPSHHVQHVHMPEDDFFMGDSLQPIMTNSPALDASTSRAVSIDGNGTNDVDDQRPDARARIVNMLKQIRDEKAKSTDGYNPDPLAAKCESCQLASVTVTRWRCNTCYCLLNQCADCLISQLISHKFEHLNHDVVVES